MFLIFSLTKHSSSPSTLLLCGCSVARPPAWFQKRQPQITSSNFKWYPQLSEQSVIGHKCYIFIFVCMCFPWGAVSVCFLLNSRFLSDTFSFSFQYRKYSFVMWKMLVFESIISRHLLNLMISDRSCEWSTVRSFSFVTHVLPLRANWNVYSTLNIDIICLFVYYCCCSRRPSPRCKSTCQYQSKRREWQCSRICRSKRSACLWECQPWKGK